MQVHASSKKPRRNFLLEAVTLLVGAVTVLVPTAFGALFFVNPLIRKSKSAGSSDGFIKVGTLSSLTPGGPPQLFQVKGVKQDAWTTYPQTELGAVYVRLPAEAGAEGQPVCFNARCPHLGCTVNFKPDQKKFVCPCHDSSFALDGTRSNDIPPRDMDPLAVEIRNGNEIWIRFQNFRAGKEERTPIA